ncbi:hypothetical protein CPC08DRAFT_508041 [Agrocybe pediades]|nr:hypothetical protein CPC08DRAFT_508041 [Agrocybe pediades]
MNVVKEINKINQAELDLGLSGASWHDEYKDSAYIFVGGLSFDLTEGDVITIFSQYGEIMDINMPRDKDTGARKGFAFIMYEDQRSTVLAVDNLNGAKVLERTLRVDHVKNYKQPKVMNDDGELVDPENPSFNAKPELIEDEGAESDSSASTGASIDPEDPMRDYLIAQKREKKALKKGKKSKGKGKHKDETPEERKARKARKAEKKAKKAKSSAMKGVEELLSSLGRPGTGPGPDRPSSEGRSDRHDRHRSRTRSRSPRRTSRSRSPRRHRSRSPRSRYDDDDDYRLPARSSRYEDEDRRRPYDHHSRGRSSRD